MLASIPLILETGPIITETIVEGVEENVGWGLFEATHTQMAYGVIGTTPLVPGGLYAAGIKAQADAIDSYNNQLIHCTAAKQN